jgi:hypothetical protein
VVVLWLVTGVVGVPVVVRQIPSLETEALVATFRKSRRATETDIAMLQRAVKVHVHSAFAVLPFIVLVTYDGSAGDRLIFTATRAVLWFGAGACFLGSSQRGAA